MALDTISISTALRSYLAEKALSGQALTSGQLRASLVDQGFPGEEIREVLFNSKRPAVVVDNLPTESFGRQPGKDATPVTYFTLRTLITSVGLEVFGYPQEKSGALFHDVYPIEGAETTNTNAGRVPFALHTENPVLPRAARPEVLALCTINNESGTETMILPISRLAARMPADVRAALESPIFTFRQNESFEMNGYAIQRKNMVILRQRDGFDEFRWAEAANHLHSTPDGEAALDWVKNIYEDLCERVVLQPGQAVIFNNHRCIHGRGSVQGRRWLKRAYGISPSPLLSTSGHIDIWDVLSQPALDHTF
jgi:hypothetical protein